MNKRTFADEKAEEILNQATRSLERFIKRSDRARKQFEKRLRKTAAQAVIKGAGTLRRQADDLQVGLKKLSARLAKVEHGRKTARRRRAWKTATAASARARRIRRLKKAA